MVRTTSFELAPIIEIIAELRWLPPNILPPQQGQIQLSFGAPDSDAFLLNFSQRPEIAAFTQSEILVPSGFPMPLHSVARRFRDPNNTSALLQIGPGIFTANALQPYKRWSEFRPTVESGVKALFFVKLNLCNGLFAFFKRLCKRAACAPIREVFLQFPQSKAVRVWF